ncbi:MAG: glycosyltransferase family 39 protein [Dehalococcoidia bacterium]
MSELARLVAPDTARVPERGASASLIARNWELLGLPLVALLVAWPQYGAPIQYNESMFVVFGREILAGGLPYRDVFDQKPPLIYYVYAGMQALTGDGFFVTRVAIILATGVTASLVTLVAREFYGRRLAFVAGLAFALTNGLVVITVNAGLDQLTLLPLMTATYLVVRWRPGGSAWRLTAAGLSAAIALLLKPVALPTALVLGGLVLVASRRVGPALWLAGAAAAVGFLALLGLALLGVLPAAYEAIIVFGREYASYGWSLSAPGERLGFWVLALLPLVLPAGASMVLLTAERTRRAAVLWLLLAAGVIGVVLPGAFLPYYVWAACAPLALMVPAVFEWLPTRSRAQRRLVILPGVFILVIMVYVSISIPAAMVPGPYVEGARELGETIARAALPGDRLYVRANAPQVYYYARLRPAHRYFTPQAIAVRPDVETEIVEALAHDPPAFVVIDEHDPGTSAALRDLLSTRYRLLDASGELAAYARP